MKVAVAALNPTPAGVTLSLIHPNHGISPPIRDEDHLTSKWLEQVFCLPGDSRDGYPNLFHSHSLAFTIFELARGSASGDGALPTKGGITKEENRPNNWHTWGE